MASAPAGGDPGSSIITGNPGGGGGGGGGGGTGVSIPYGQLAGAGASASGSKKAQNAYNQRYNQARQDVAQYGSQYGDWQKGIEALVGTPGAPGALGNLLYGPRTTTSTQKTDNTTSPTIAPEFAQSVNLMKGILQNRLASPTGLPAG